MTGLFSYLTHSFDPDNFRLVMTLLVKNEIDIIEPNIRTHARFGIDAFVIMDNGSVDGTRESLEKLSGEFEITIIDRPDPVYRQREWMTEMARRALSYYRADYVISSDADEFWIPEDKKMLKEALTKKAAIILIQRSNMALDEKALDDNYRFYDSIYRVKYPICYDQRVQLSDENISMILAPIKPKAIIDPRGLIKMKGGNHDARHWAKWFGRSQTDAIHIYHFPVRGYSQFEKNIANRKQLLETTKGVRMGDHYKRWVRMLDQGKLYEEYRKLVLDSNDLRTLKRLGVIEKDETVRKILFKECEKD